MFNLFISSENFTLGINKWLSVLCSNNLLEISFMLFNKLLISKHKSNFYWNRNIFPLTESIFGISNNSIKFSLSRLWALSNQFLCGWAMNIESFFSCRINPSVFAVVLVLKIYKIIYNKLENLQQQKIFFAIGFEHLFRIRIYTLTYL